MSAKRENINKQGESLRWKRHQGGTPAIRFTIHDFMIRRFPSLRLISRTHCLSITSHQLGKPGHFFRAVVLPFLPDFLAAAGSYFSCTAPSSNVFASTNFSPRESTSSRNKGLPLPRTNGHITRRYSSIRPPLIRMGPKIYCPKSPCSCRTVVSVSESL